MLRNSFFRVVQSEVEHAGYETQGVWDQCLTQSTTYRQGISTWAQEGQTFGELASLPQYETLPEKKGSIFMLAFTQMVASTTKSKSTRLHEVLVCIVT